MTKRIEVSAVAFQDGDMWVAQCVEYDIAAFSRHLAELPKAFERALAANFCANADLGRDALDGIPAAPPKFRELFEHADSRLTPTRQPAIAKKSPIKVLDLRVAEAA
ncbi:MAG TPA: hypothetical protein VFE10_10395 [Phenylobacterium sp.]|jgi:hypothetical protein|nr:hypothetical protein [Phenylobacterium sp.]